MSDEPARNDNPLHDSGLRAWVDRHPTTMRWLALAVLFGLILYAVLAGLTTQLVEIQRESCERGNATRVAEKAVLSGERSSAETKRGIAIQRGETAYVYAYGQEERNADRGIEELVRVAQSSGYATSAGSVTISCGDATPPPLPWFQSP